MEMKILVSAILIQLFCRKILGELVKRKFPENFLFGAATSAYQVEGGWDDGDKGENIWDRFTHDHPEKIADLSDADITCDSYHNFHLDIEMLIKLNVDFYRFSLSWSRIFPTGFVNIISESGVTYYKKLISILKFYDIEPFVTLYHWDLPQPLEEIGGWTNPVLADYFADYAKVVFNIFGEDVKNWVTFNEPKQICQMGYGYGIYAPGKQSDGIGSYLCGHTILKAHANVYHIYNNIFKPIQDGRISIILDTEWFEPSSEKNQDKEAAERKIQFNFGWFANPIYHPDGNYPRVMIDRIANRSQMEGFTKSRLPKFTSEEIDSVKGTYDFFGLNFYTTNLAQWRDDDTIGTPSWESDISVTTYQNKSWNGSASSWLKVVPWGARKILNWIDKAYNHPEIIITGNGYSDSGELDDHQRIHYHSEYLSNILEAIFEDGVKVTGYTVWSLMDNFEWLSGYTEKFGLYQVDFSNPQRTRTIKSSGEYYKKVISTRCLVKICED